MGYLPDTQLGCEVVCFQDFSLMGQPRGESKRLRTLFSDFGIGKGKSVGCVGWKYFDGVAIDNAEGAIEIPAYLVDLLRDRRRAGPARRRPISRQGTPLTSGSGTLTDPGRPPSFVGPRGLKPAAL